MAFAASAMARRAQPPAELTAILQPHQHTNLPRRVARNLFRIQHFGGLFSENQGIVCRPRSNRKAETFHLVGTRTDSARGLAGLLYVQRLRINHGSFRVESYLSWL